MEKLRSTPRLALRLCRAGAIVLACAATSRGQAPQYPPTAPPPPANYPPQTAAPSIGLGTNADVGPTVVPATHLTPAKPATFASEPAPLPPAPATALPRPGARPPAKLPPPGAAGRSPEAPRGGLAGMFTVAGSLVLVLGLFLLAARLLRRGAPQQVRLLPKEAVEVLGRMPLPARRQGYLIRVGNKIVLVGFAPAGCDVLAEVDDAQEVDRLAGLCFQADPHGATQSFRGVVEQFFREKPAARSTTSAAAAVAKETDVV